MSVKCQTYETWSYWWYIFIVCVTQWDSELRLNWPFNDPGVYFQLLTRMEGVLNLKYPKMYSQPYGLPRPALIVWSTLQWPLPIFSSVSLSVATKFKVCKSVHYRTIQIYHQPDATIFQFIIMTFIYSSTCFARSPAHHQELDCSSGLWFYLRIVVIAVLCSWSGRTSPITNTAQLSPRYEGKTRGCYCSRWAPDDGWENARNMLSCK